MIRPGLERITRLLAHLPTPNYPTVHVAGTNGKGSICAYLTTLLLNHSQSSPTTSPFKRIGRFTSPHLVYPGDNITINNDPLPSSSYNRLSTHIAAINVRENIGASEFEQLTATAFTAFVEEHVDIGIIECGMGGRLDATNVLVNPVVTVIARLGFDHQAFLGTTAEAIAMEKAGIMREGVPCVVDSGSEKAFLNEVLRQGEMKGAPVTLTPSPETASEDFESLFRDIPAETLARDVPATAQQNMWTAYLAYKHLLSSFSLPSPTPTSISQTIAKILQAPTPTPGRFHSLSLTFLFPHRQTPIFLDGAHNTQAFSLLVHHLAHQRRTPDERITWLLACTSSRDPDELVELIPEGDSVVATTFGGVEGMPWVRPCGVERWTDVLEGLRRAGMWNVDPDVMAALGRAVEVAGDGPLVVAGSLYLVGDVLRLVDGRK